MKKFNLAMVILGCLLIFAGAVTALYTIGRSGEEVTRTLGLLMVSLGSVGVAVPFYLEAAALRKHYRPEIKRNLSPCSVCSAPTATLWCTTHTARICSACLSKHDEPTRCLYRTLGRPSGSAGRAAGQGAARP